MESFTSFYMTFKIRFNFPRFLQIFFKIVTKIVEFFWNSLKTQNVADCVIEFKITLLRILKDLTFIYSLIYSQKLFCKHKLCGTKTEKCLLLLFYSGLSKTFYNDILGYINNSQRHMHIIQCYITKRLL